jgi:hypothetical protein
MNELTITAAVILGIILRFGIPIALTFGFAWLLRRLDEKWRAEAQVEASEAKYKTQQKALLEMWLQKPCWEVNNCAKEDYVNCKAYQQKDLPCWEVYRANGKYNESCRDCAYRKNIIDSIFIYEGEKNVQ